MSLVITKLPFRKNRPSGVVNLLSVLVIGSSVCRGLPLVIHLVKGHSIGGFTGKSRGQDVIILSEYGLCCTHCLINFASQLWVSWWTCGVHEAMFGCKLMKEIRTVLRSINRFSGLKCCGLQRFPWITAMDLSFHPHWRDGKEAETSGSFGCWLIFGTINALGHKLSSICFEGPGIRWFPSDWWPCECIQRSVV